MERKEVRFRDLEPSREMGNRAKRGGEVGWKRRGKREGKENGKGMG